MHLARCERPYCRLPGPGVGSRAVVAESQEPLLSTGQPERRPAIWPWLVMPLVALLLFYALSELKKTQDAASLDASGSASSSAESAIP